MAQKRDAAERVEFDNYPTPAWCVRRLLERAPLPGGRWYEPCASDGAIIKACSESEDCRAVGFVANELRAECEPALRELLTEVTIGDYLTALTPRLDVTCIITNPPFYMWHEIAEKALREAPWVALLLRLSALAHLGDLPTPSVYVLPDRPNFVAAYRCRSMVSDITDGCGWRATVPIGDRVRECPQCGSSKLRRTTSDASEYAWFVWGPQPAGVVVLAETPLAERKAA